MFHDITDREFPVRDRVMRLYSLYDIEVIVLFLVQQDPPIRVPVNKLYTVLTQFSLLLPCITERDTVRSHYVVASALIDGLATGVT